MPEKPDDARRVSGSRLCEICGVVRQTRDRWADQGLLRRADGYGELDLVEVAVLNLLYRTIRKMHVEVAWASVRPSLRSVVPGTQLTLVWDPQRRSAELALDDEAIARLVRHGRPTQVLDIGAAIDQARTAFRREVSRARPVEPHLAQARGVVPKPQRTAPNPAE
jgi:hypothetical protein